MSRVADAAWALWGAIGDLSSQQFDDLSVLLRAELAQPLRDRLRADPSTAGKSGRLRALAELHAIETFPEQEAVQALAVWAKVARDQLGERFVGSFDRRRTALSEPGRDPSIAGFAEKAKVDVRDDLVGIEWLTLGSTAAASVAFLTVPRYFASTRNQEVVGTGFLVTEDRQHVMTAYHVIEARQRERGETEPAPADLARQITEMTVAFDYVAGGDPARQGTPLAVTALVAHDPQLDYAVVRLAAPVAMEPLTLYTGDLPAIDGGVGFVANIVQHPMRKAVPQPKQLGLRNNAVWKYDDRKLFYFTDTQAGSSGSPVLSDGWQVLALHTGYEPVTGASYLGRGFPFANRGSLMRRVVDDARHKLPAGVQLRVSGPASGARPG